MENKKIYISYYPEGNMSKNALDQRMDVILEKDIYRQPGCKEMMADLNIAKKITEHLPQALEDFRDNTRRMTHKTLLQINKIDG